MGKIRALRHIVRELTRTGARHRIAPVEAEGIGALFSRLTGALVRAFLMMALVMAPSAILPGTGVDGRQMAALIGLLAGILTFIEYNAAYPSLIEFRDAKPFNRLRFIMLALIVFSLSLVLSAQDAPTPLNRLLLGLGTVFANLLDFPYSPVRLATLALAEGAGPMHLRVVQAAAGLASLLAWLSVILTLLFLRLDRWPGPARHFNVWVNLPTFQPTPGGGISEQLERDARLNLALGFILPFLLPAIVLQLSGGLKWQVTDTAQALLWVLVAWAYAPAALVMRGAAMARAAAMFRASDGQEKTDPAPRATAAA